jgi:hypothetical protein
MGSLKRGRKFNIVALEASLDSAKKKKKVLLPKDR